MGALWSVLTIAGWVLDSIEPSTGTDEALGALLLIVAWVGGAITSFAIRPAYERRIGTYLPGQGQWPQPTAQSRQWSARYALTAYVLTFAGGIALAAILRFGVGVKLGVGVGVLMVDAILLVSLVPLRRRHGLTREDLGLRTTRAGRSVGLVVLGLLAYGLVSALWIAAVLHPGSNPANLLAGVKNQSTLSIFLAVFAAAVSAPVVEEIFFRGLLYRSLRNKFPILPAALIAGSLFGLVHITSYPVDTLPIKAAFGVIACLLYERTGSLLPGIAMHSFVDASAIALALTGNDAIVLAIFLLLAIVVLVLGFVRRASDSNGPYNLAESG